MPVDRFQSFPKTVYFRERPGCARSARVQVLAQCRAGHGGRADLAAPRLNLLHRFTASPVKR